MRCKYLAVGSWPAIRGHRLPVKRVTRKLEIAE